MSPVESFEVTFVGRHSTSAPEDVDFLVVLVDMGGAIHFVIISPDYSSFALLVFVSTHYLINASAGVSLALAKKVFCAYDAQTKNPKPRTRCRG